MEVSIPLKPRPQGFRKKIQRETEVPNVQHGYVKSFDDTRIFYSIEGTGKPIIFCYGLVCSSLHWTYQISHFRKSHQAIWFDYRGHQNSDVPKDMNSLTLDAISQDLEILLDELKVKDAVFMGHSMGVNVVLEFYRRHPEKVKGMILANGAATRPLETMFRHNSMQAGFELINKIYKQSPFIVRKVWQMMRMNPLTKTLITLGGFNPHLTPSDDINLYIQQVGEMDPAILINLIHNYRNVDAAAWLHTVKAPTLIIAGEQDRLIPVEQQELLHQLIPNSQIEVIKHGSHCPQMDLPEHVNLRIEKFMQEIGY
jgi:pimeloyl-ACP methyl ester carboxylesterase